MAAGTGTRLGRMIQHVAACVVLAPAVFLAGFPATTAGRGQLDCSAFLEPGIPVSLCDLEREAGRPNPKLLG